MSNVTKIQWCDSTVNPLMGCAGCELWESNAVIFKGIDTALKALHPDVWKQGEAKVEFLGLLKKKKYLDRLQKREGRNNPTPKTTDINHLQEPYAELIANRLNSKQAGRVVIAKIRDASACYAAKMHLAKGTSIANPNRKINKGYAPIFEDVTRFHGRVWKMAKEKDLIGTYSENKSWINGLPRLVFVSDMGDALSRKSDFNFLKKEVIEPIISEEGRRHIWLWLTKRPGVMAEFAHEIGGLPENIVAMTTLTAANAKARQRLQQLASIKAKLKGLSLEPLRSEIPAELLDVAKEQIDWIIVGGESGHKAHCNPFHAEWALGLEQYCRENEIAFFCKQMGSRPYYKGELIKFKDSHGGDWNEWSILGKAVVEKLKIREFPRGFYDYRPIPKMPSGERPAPSGKRQKSDPEEAIRMKLSAKDSKRFHDLNETVTNAAISFVHAAEALAEIKKDRLYRQDYDTFEQYCQEVHAFTRQYANKLIKAGKIKIEMETIVSRTALEQLSKEAHFRELGRLPKADQRKKVAELAVKDNPGNVTAKLLSQLVDNELKKNGLTKTSWDKPDLAMARSKLDELELALQGIKNPKYKPLVRSLRAMLMEA